MQALVEPRRHWALGVSRDMQAGVPRPDHAKRLEQMRREADFPLTYFLINPVNRRLVGLLDALRVPPNAVTFGSLAVTMAGGLALYFAVQGIVAAAVAAPLLVFFGHLLDALDGDLARYSDDRSIFGEAVDPVLDRIGEWFLILCISAGLYRNAPEAVYWLAGAAAAAGDLIYFYTADAHLSRLMKAKPNEARRYVLRAGDATKTQIKFGLYEPMKYALALGPCVGLGLPTLVFVAAGYWAGLLFQIVKLYRVSKKTS